MDTVVKNLTTKFKNLFRVLVAPRIITDIERSLFFLELPKSSFKDTKYVT